MSGCENELFHTLDFVEKIRFFLVFRGAFRDNNIDITFGNLQAFLRLKNMSKKLVRSKRRLIITITAVVLIVTFLLLILKSLTGKMDRGTVNHITELPCVGEYLKELKVKGDIKFVSWMSYPRPYRIVVFTAESSLKDVKAFFDPNSGARIYPGEVEYGSILQTSLIKMLKIDSNDFPQGRNREDFVAEREITADGLSISILMSYRVDDERFTVKVIRISKNYRD